MNNPFVWIALCVLDAALDVVEAIYWVGDRAAEIIAGIHEWLKAKRDDVQ